MQYNHVDIRAEGVVSFKVSDGDVTADVEDLSTVHVAYNEESDQAQLQCSACGRDLIHTLDGYLDEEDGWRCVDVDPQQLHKPVAKPLTWVKSASIDPNPDDDSITVAVSVGDPRGAFCMYLRKTPDGRILMDVPHPEQSGLHLPLTQIMPGVYRVGAA